MCLPGFASRLTSAGAAAQGLAAALPDGSDRQVRWPFRSAHGLSKVFALEGAIMPIYWPSFSAASQSRTRFGDFHLGVVLLTQCVSIRSETHQGFNPNTVTE
jgi:hypothetical protein